MIRLYVGGLLWAMCGCAATLAISPETVNQCASGLGRVTLSWSGASGPVDVRVGSSQGVSMTGVVGPEGSASSGNWVTDGLGFFLVNQQGVAEAQATARVRCGSVPPPMSYFPLEVGNQWVYRLDSRLQTSDYLTRTITGTGQVNGLTYYTVSDQTGQVVMRLRLDADGRILRLAGNGEAVLVDPRTALAASLTGPLGVFADALRVVTTMGGLIREESFYVRGIGLARSSATMLTGSSGGFVLGLELVEARLDGGIRLVLPAAQVSLSIEKTVLDVTGRKVTNCAVPSYCVACGLIGADPPGTYKPCVQARVEGRPGADLELRNPAGTAVFRAAALAGSLRYVQVPLYSRPNEPLAPGLYTLVVKANGEAEASMVVRIE